MYPSNTDRVKGRFVYDQVEALRDLPDVEIELFAFGGGGVRSYPKAARELRQRYKHDSFDVVHAHFGLTAWVSFVLRGMPHAVTLHGTDLHHPRSRKITLEALPFVDLIGVTSEELKRSVPGRFQKKVEVLPCGVDLDRFAPIDRAAARLELGLDMTKPYLLFPADPARPEKRFDRAKQLSRDVELLTLGDVDPKRVPLYVNAANAVLVTSDRESFGLAALEALACNVPVLSTNVGVAPEALAGIDGCLCAPFQRERWQPIVDQHVATPDPRVFGRSSAESYGMRAMAQRVLAAWQRLSP